MILIIKVLLGVLVAIVCYFIRSILSYESDLKRKANQINDHLKQAPKNQDHYIFTDNGAIRTTYDYDS